MPTLPQALFHNWRLKASALGMAVFLWALVQTEPRSEETFSAVPIEVEIADTSWTLGAPPQPGTVELRLDGPAREIIRLAREGATLSIPVTSVGSPDTLIALRREWVQLGQRGGLVVQSVSPSAIRLTLERAVTRLVPVSPRVQGRVREHLALAAAVSVSPQLARVHGPASRVLPLDSIPLRSFDLGRVTGSGIYTVAVDTTALGGGTVMPATATLEIRVEDMTERVLDEMAVQADVGPGGANVVLDPTTVRLTLKGARTLVTSLDPEGLRIWIPPEFLQDMAPGEVRRLHPRVDGIPELVTAMLGTQYIDVRRAIDLPGDGGGG